MNEKINQPAEASRPAQSETHGAEAANAKTWSDLSANLWSSQESLSLPRDGWAGAGLPAGAAQAPALKADSGTKSADSSLPPLEIGDFKAEALQVFDRLDTSHQGFVSNEQMAVAIQNDPSIKGGDAEALAALYGLKQDEGREAVPSNINRGIITRAEIQDMPTSVAQEQFNLNNLETISNPATLSIFDTNNDGRISQAEVSNALGAKVGAEYGQMARDYASKYLDPAEQAQVRQSGLTTAELNELVQVQTFRNSEAKDINHLLHYADSSLANAQNPEAFENIQNPVQSIKPNDVRQGLTGDCYFDATLSAVAATQPETIANSIKENKDGSYTVTFKGDPEHPINVPAPTDAELALYNAATPDGIWPNIMEKAFADHQVLFGQRHIDNDTPQDAIAGGVPETAFALLTGEQTQYQYMTPGQGMEAETGPHGAIPSPVEQLEGAATEGDDAVVQIGRVLPGSHLTARHAYTVVGYYPGDNGGTFELRNPWDNQSERDGDYFSISADRLGESMSGIAYAPPS